MGLHLHIDPFAGIAGDMFLGACVDLGVPLSVIEAALKPLPVAPPYRITIADTTRHAIRGVDLKVEVQKPSPIITDTTMPKPAAKPAAAQHHDHDHDHAHDHDHGDGPAHAHVHTTGGGPHTGYRQIMAMIDQLDTAERAKHRARRIVTRLGEAEAAVHGVSLDLVHFHEVGAVDSIVDMLGSAVALEHLDVETVTSAPLPIGQGWVQCDHGRMPLPAPATAQILRGVPHFGVEWKGETVTPTGAAIVWAITDAFGPMPAMEVDKIGYGAGDRDPAEVPNLLRLFLGKRVTAMKPKP